MRFEHPNLLWLLLVIPPALGLFFWWAERARQRLLTQFVEARLPTTREWCWRASRSRWSGCGSLAKVMMELYHADARGAYVVWALARAMFHSSKASLQVHEWLLH